MYSGRQEFVHSTQNPRPSLYPLVLLLPLVYILPLYDVPGVGYVAFYGTHVDPLAFRLSSIYCSIYWRSQPV